MSAFGAAALVLAMIGLYGVIAFLGTTTLACVLPAVRASGVDPRAALDAG